MSFPTNWSGDFEIIEIITARRPLERILCELSHYFISNTFSSRLPINLYTHRLITCLKASRTLRSA